MDNLKYYDDKFFKKRAGWRSDYEAIAKWAGKNIEGKTFGDIGCGNGYMIATLHKLGKKVWGVDGAASFEKFVDKAVHPYVKKADLTQPRKFAKSDVILCFEVAERIDKRYADILISSIASAAAATILFTAAKPGEAGVRHINLQPRKYWLDKFSKHGYCLDTALSEKFRSDLAEKIKSPTWYLDDIMVLQKCDSQKTVKAYATAGKMIEELKLQAEDLAYMNAKLKLDLWNQGQYLNSILNSARWKASSKLIRIFKR